jgi:hypothetical protein
MDYIFSGNDASALDPTEDGPYFAYDRAAAASEAVDDALEALPARYVVSKALLLAARTLIARAGEAMTEKP